MHAYSTHTIPQYHISKGLFTVLFLPYILCLTINKNASGRFTSKLDTAEKRISEVEDISIVTSKTEKKRDWKPTEQNIQGLKGNYKRWNIHIMRTSQGKETKKGTKA